MRQGNLPHFCVFHFTFGERLRDGGEIGAETPLSAQPTSPLLGETKRYAHMGCAKPPL